MVFVILRDHICPFSVSMTVVVRSSCLATVYLFFTFKTAGYIDMVWSLLLKFSLTLSTFAEKQRWLIDKLVDLFFQPSSIDNK